MRHRPEANDDQKRIADLLHLDVDGDTEHVAAARIEDAVAPAVHPGWQPRSATEKQLAFAASLGIDVVGDSLGVASAKIDDALFARSAAALDSMGLEPGDWVVKRDTFEFNGETTTIAREFQVSSIEPRSLRVWFRGGNGQGAWPTQLEKIDRPSPHRPVS